MSKKKGSVGMPESARMIHGVPHVPLTDDFHQDEPLGFLVKCCDDTMGEYKLFGDQRQAESYAVQQEQDYLDKNGEPTDWDVYPLYASHPITDL